MPSTTPYYLFIRGVNAHVDCDALSEVETDTADTFPTAIAAPSVPNGWLRIGFYSAKAEDVSEGERYPGPGGARYDESLVFRQYTINLAVLTWPDDEALREELYEHLRARQLFIAFDVYETLAPQHTAGKCIAVTREYETDHKDERGTKQITLTLQKRKPYA